MYNTPDAHVTRDIREGVAKLGDLQFVLADTAGLETDAQPAHVLARTAGLTAAALKAYQMALFLVDGRFLRPPALLSSSFTKFSFSWNIDDVSYRADGRIV